jgi:SAM-dependent methyltransferase
VVEIASNDGYLLQYFAALGIPVLGIEPAVNVAEVARSRGVPTQTRFFGMRFALELSSSGTAADLIVANNVIAHVPDLNDFVEGFRHLLKPEGVLSIEVPHLLRLLEGVQFDTIYHEHFSYFSLYTAERVLTAHGLRIFDVEELPTHGGSLRISACLASAGPAETGRLEKVRAGERRAKIDAVETYADFGKGVEDCRRALQRFLAEARARDESVVAYGAAAKGNTLLNYCAVSSEDMEYVVDRNPHKQGRFLPGTHLPILGPEHVAETKPDYLLILPWNLQEEIMDQMTYVREWGGRFVTPIPEVRIYE